MNAIIVFFYSAPLSYKKTYTSKVSAILLAAHVVVGLIGELIEFSWLTAAGGSLCNLVYCGFDLLIESSIYDETVTGLPIYFGML